MLKMLHLLLAWINQIIQTLKKQEYFAHNEQSTPVFYASLELSFLITSTFQIENKRFGNKNL